MSFVRFGEDRWHWLLLSQNRASWRLETRTPGIMYTRPDAGNIAARQSAELVKPRELGALGGCAQ